MPKISQHSLVPILIIMAGLLIWGALHALGAFLFRETYDYRKPLIVLVCVGGFIFTWACLLLLRHRRNSTSPSPPDPVSNDSPK
jgi:hypothetical protein